eukprot:6242383-Alexandrium_andersonii.AAC.1
MRPINPVHPLERLDRCLCALPPTIGMVLEELWINKGAEHREEILGPALRILQSMQGGGGDDGEINEVLTRKGNFIDWDQYGASVTSRYGSQVKKPATL